MSNPDSGYRSGGFLRPGMKAFEAGVKHAMLAENVIDIFSPQKKQKLMPPVKKSYGRSSSSSKTTKRTVAKASSVVKKTILSMANTKTHQQNDSALAQLMTHNNIYTNNLTAKLQLGTADNQRIGDQVYLTNLVIRGNFISAVAAKGYQYRIIVGYSGEEYDPANFGSSGAGTGLNHDQIFLPTTGSQYATSSIINPKAFTVLYDKMFTINSNIIDVSEFIGIDLAVPLYKKFPYQAGASIYGKTKNLYLICVSSVQAGVTLTTASGACNISTCLKYKNM